MKKIDTHMNEFKLPRYCHQDSLYFEDLKSILQAYSDYIKTVKGLRKDTTLEVDENIRLILQSIIDYYNANFRDYPIFCVNENRLNLWV